MIFKKGQFSIVEIAFVILLISSGLYYVYEIQQPLPENYNFQIESALNSLYINDSFRSLVISEDLSVSGVSGNWTLISNLLDAMFSEYELQVSNISVSKNIFSCSSNYNKYYDERVVGVSDGSVYEFRTVRLGVCY